MCATIADHGGHDGHDGHHNRHGVRGAEGQNYANDLLETERSRFVFRPHNCD